MATKTEKLIEKIDAIAYQRNGISGTGFHQVFFRDEEGHQLIGVVFPENKHVAVINPLSVESHWRGDRFELELRTAITKWSLERYGTKCYGCETESSLVVDSATGRRICSACGRGEDES